MTGDWGWSTGDWGHRRGEAVRPHAIRQTVMDRANAQINRLEVVEGALHRGQGFVVEHTVGADRPRTAHGIVLALEKIAPRASRHDGR